MAVINMRTSGFYIKLLYILSHGIFKCFIWFSLQVHLISLSIISFLVFIICTDGLIIPFLYDAMPCRLGEFSSTIRTIVVFPSSGPSSLKILKVKTLKFFETRKIKKRCIPEDRILWPCHWENVISRSESLLCDLTERTVRVRVRLLFTIYISLQFI
jgi:hypothetical protein